ncbi:MAG: PGF-pre-PGF domain-containing protein [Candidatus Woesearchaeota archaeon]
MKRKNIFALLSYIILVFMLLIKSYGYIEFSYANFYPLNNTKTNNQSVLFSYVVSSNVSENINCEFFVNNNQYSVNETLNNFPTYIEVNSNSLNEGINSWFINCMDDEGNLQSDVFNLIIDRMPPYVNNNLYGISLKDIDNFLPYNSLLNISADVRDSLSNVYNVSFDLSNVCTDLTITKTNKETDDLYWADCIVDINEYLSLKEIKIFACDELGNCGNIFNYSLMIYNFTYPSEINEENNYLGFDMGITTNLANVDNLANTNYVLGILLNGSQMPGKPYEDIKLAAKLNFSSIDFTNPNTYNNFANLPYAINIIIKNAKQGYYGGSRIFINTNIFSAFNTQTEITLYNLPFSFIEVNDIFPDDEEDSVLYAKFNSNEDGTGNLTFIVSGFSGYNIVDNEKPKIISYSINNQKSNIFEMNVSFNGTGTEIDLNRINLRLYSNSSYFDYNFDNLTCVYGLDNKQTLICNATLINDLVIDSYNLSVYDYGGTNGLSEKLENCFSDWSEYSECINNQKVRKKYCYGILLEETLSCSSSSGSSGGSHSSGGSSGSPGNFISNEEKSKISQTWQVMMPLKPSIMKLNSNEIALTEISINVKNPANNVRIIVEKVDNQTKEFKEIKGKIYKYIKIEKENLADEKIEKVNLKFKIEKKWLIDNKINEKNIYLMRYKNNEWEKLKTSLINKDNNYTYYESETAGFSYFVIAEINDTIFNENNINIGVIENNITLSNSSLKNNLSNDKDVIKEDINSNGININANKKGILITIIVIFILIIVLIFMLRNDKILKEYNDAIKEKVSKEKNKK